MLRIFQVLLLVLSFRLALGASIGLVKRVSASDTADIGFATGTTGGAGGSTVTVTSLAALTSAVAGTAKKTVLISGRITGKAVVNVGSNTSILGKAGSSLEGVGLRLNKQSNVIIRNVKISKVEASVGDALGIQESSRVWVDHVDLSSDLDHGKDFYDGLLDVTHGCTQVTVSNSKLSNHFKASLVGHSDSNKAEDTKITVTYANNHWLNLNSRAPSVRFGTAHIFNNLFEKVSDGINTRVGAQVLVENNVWKDSKKALFSTSQGFAVLRGNDFGGASNSAPTGTFTTPPYKYSLLSTANVASTIPRVAGQTLAF
ncbi:hypothetical protein H1R20_g2378, partial [Candolleomyces eurysporus]